MKPTDPKAIAEALSRALPNAPLVRVTGVASLGAQRQTLFLELRPRDDPEDESSARLAVAQIASQVVAAAPVTQEGALLRAATKAGVPVPEVLAVDANLGAIVSECVAGETIPRKILRMVETHPSLGGSLASDLGEAFAAIHRMPTDDLLGFEDYSDPLRYADEMAALLDNLSSPQPSFRLGVRWLRRHAPALSQSGIIPPCLIHGDLRLGNFIADEDGLRAVLDWELAHLGDPMEDLAWICLRTWRFGNDALEVGGFGALADLRRAYEQAGGIWREDAFDWWTVARTLWWGIGLARQVEAFLGGASSSIVLAASGRRVAELEYDLLRLIEA